MRFADPSWFWLLILAPLPMLTARKRLGWPSLVGYNRLPIGWSRWGRAAPGLLRALAAVGMVMALARPQTVAGWSRVAGQGIAIIVALDQSSSMGETRDFLAPDGSPHFRLDAAKGTLARFIAGRPDDVIGLVTFAQFPDLTCAPTLQHDFLLDAVRTTRTALPGDDGTNIGDAIAWSLDALAATPLKSKVLILLTDGANEPVRKHPPPLDPRAAAQLARDLGVTLHTIALGRPELDPITGLAIRNPGSDPDLDLLQDMATITGGRVFAATDLETLDEVFHAIDQLEKVPVQGFIRTRYRDWYAACLAAALGCLLLDFLLTTGRFRRLP